MKTNVEINDFDTNIINFERKNNRVFIDVGCYTMIVSIKEAKGLIEALKKLVNKQILPIDYWKKFAVDKFINSKVNNNIGD